MPNSLLFKIAGARTHEPVGNKDPVIFIFLYNFLSLPGYLLTVMLKPSCNMRSKENLDEEKETSLQMNFFN